MIPDMLFDSFDGLYRLIRLRPAGMIRENDSAKIIGIRQCYKRLGRREGFNSETSPYTIEQHAGGD